MTVRCHLHYLSRRDNNILDIAAQEQIAFCLKYSNRKNIFSRKVNEKILSFS